jgi:hypothetical protein
MILGTRGSANSFSPRAATPIGLVLLLLALAVLVPSSVQAAPYPWDYDITIELLGLPVEHSPAPLAADWNADGLDDLVVGLKSTSLYGGVAVYLRNADGTLQPPFSAFESGNASSVIGYAVYFRPAVGDWNGDGNKDLIFGQYYGSKGVVLCLNQGSDSAPVFHGASCAQMRTAGDALVGITTGSTIGYTSPEIVNWDNDTDLDLLVGTGATANEKGVRLYRNVGTPTMPVLDEPVFVVSKAGTPGLTYENYYEPSVVDINDDGMKDLMIGGGQNSANTTQFFVRQCLNSGTDAAPVFASCTYRALSGLVNNVIDFSDWDGDGYVDMLRGFYSGFITNPVTLFHGRSPDDDGDGVPNTLDNCPADYNPADMKLDRDNPVQIDTDADGRGDVCDADDDGDTVDDSVDNCVWTPNGDQSDVDADGRGDRCDPLDDRPGYPGVGSYEWEQANRMAWGRRPVIVMRADALSLTYRREIAIALAQEATSRGIPFSLAVIPWNEARFSGTPSATFLSDMAPDPYFEMVQHGTYHACMYTAGSGPEFDCGMDGARSYNLMRVGRDSMANSVELSSASHQLTGFIPPEDAYDDAAHEAAVALGYRYLASAFYQEYPNFSYVDDLGMVHIPWSQTACGNGGATWLDCRTTSLEAHVGVDCADEAICKPTLDGQDYTPWEVYAANTLKERCRYDIEQRYGMCSIIFELTVYDDGTGNGTLDPVAFEGYQKVLSDLQDLAQETNAVFMTLGEFAAANLIDDTQPPMIAIHVPAAVEYEHHEILTIDFEVTDDLSGVYSVQAYLDGVPVEDGDTIDLLQLSLGQHTLTVIAEDTASNVTEQSVTFTVVATLHSLEDTVMRLLESGDIDNKGIANSLLAKLDAAQAAYERGNVEAARNILDAFINEVEAQRGKHISEWAADLLIADASAVRDAL